MEKLTSLGYRVAGDEPDFEINFGKLNETVRVINTITTLSVKATIAEIGDAFTRYYITIHNDKLLQDKEAITLVQPYKIYFKSVTGEILFKLRDEFIKMGYPCADEGSFLFFIERIFDKHKNEHEYKYSFEIYDKEMFNDKRIKTMILEYLI